MDFHGRASTPATSCLRLDMSTSTRTCDWASGLVHSSTVGGNWLGTERGTLISDGGTLISDGGVLISLLKMSERGGWVSVE